MFELTLTNDIKSEFAIQPNTRYGFNPALHETFEFENHFLYVGGLSYKCKQNDYYENEEYLILICGLVYHRLCSSDDLNPIYADEILNKFLKEGNDFLDKVKGNFIIVIYNKSMNSLILAKDQLGLKYIYYRTKGSLFYISTNLSDFKKIPYLYNRSAILEKILFTYPIGSESFIEGAYFLEQGSLLKIDNSGLKTKSYFKIDNIFSHELKPKPFDKQHFLELFEKSVLQRANASTKINVALTGGFDGRSIVSVLLKNKRRLHAYSFGKQGGENTKVPLLVASKLNLDYSPIYLDEEYENNYAKCALDSIYFSDGISTFERANYIYAMIKLSASASYNLTGLIGGEVFAPVHMLTDYISESYFNIVYKEAHLGIKDILIKSGLEKYFDLNNLYNDVEEKISENVKMHKEQIQLWKEDKYAWMFYLKDLMSTGFQRFYGNQMHLERYFNENLTPFYDLDLLSYIFSTNHLDVYKKAFNSNPYVRRNNRKLQSLIIRNFSHSLGEITVDRGYPPNYTNDFRKLLIPIHFYKRKILSGITPPDFISPVWNQAFFSSLDLEIADKQGCEFFNSKEIYSSIRNYLPSKHNTHFNHLLSMFIWLTNDI